MGMSAVGIKASASRGPVDRLGFAALYERHCDAVYNHCFRRIAAYERAEDLVAVVFLEVWRRRADLPADAELPWLLGVANNVLRNHWRAERRYRNVLRRLPRADHSADPAVDVATEVDAERAMAVLAPALARLPHREREVVELCIGSSLGHADAAAALGIPLGTVKSRLSRALRRLRDAPEFRAAAAQSDVLDEGWSR